MSNKEQFCGSCGTELSSGAKFCRGCGASVRIDSGADPETGSITEAAGAAAVTSDPPPAGGHGDKPPPGAGAAAGATRRAEQVVPDARQFASAIGQGLNTPGVSLALVTGGVALGVSLVIGAVFALTLGGSNDSLVGAPLTVADGGLKEIFMATVGTTMARMRLAEYAAWVLPSVFVIAPVGGAALGAWWQAERTQGMKSLPRIAWGAAGGVPLAIGMVIIGLLSAGGDQWLGYNVAGVFLLSLLWGALGGACGTLLAIRPLEPTALPDRLTVAAGLMRAPLVSLAAVLTVAGFFGTAGWIYSTIAKSFSETQKTLPGIVDSILLSGNYAITGADAGMFAAFHPSASMALPPSRDLLVSAPREFFLAGGSPIRIFDYNEFYAVWLLIPTLIIFVGVPLIAAVYSGYSTARSAGSRSPAAAAAFGAITGVVWTIILTIASAIFSVGVVGGSVFGLVLLVGVVCGALGGFLFASTADGTGAQPNVERVG